MARWKLMTSHYLNIPGTDWVYEETDRNTGKRGRKVFPVPTLMDPADPTIQNRMGDVVVTDSDTPERGEHQFLGEPTPDMEPMDDDAEKISVSLAHKWKHPIETLPGQGDYSQSLISAFQRQIDEIIALKPPTPANPIPVAGVDPAAFAELQEQVAALMAKNAELQAAAEKPARRV